MEKESSSGYLTEKKFKISFLYKDVLSIQFVEISDSIIRKGHVFAFF